MLLNDARDAPRGDTLAAVVEKYGRFAPAGATPFFALLGGIVCQRAKRYFSDGDDAFFGTFADDANDAQLKIDVHPAQPADRVVPVT